ncbi:hypothetical protein CMUST_01235 [Corynebacterium mustelae]|uniref:Uncharacterized protein n=1 Tax=Corynebacterium mustelae TaxID=571915 RepID=A0A0G3GTU7_9CORY|nr:hypothetical protein [Corynebacterium mustelae]AKK04596.1 hypothetical protein CMUST_01235 [Corynebacterium mustelae]
MSHVDFYKLQQKNDSLLLAALNLTILLAPRWVKFDGQITVNDEGKIKELPEGFFSVGQIEKKAGMDMAPDTKLAGPEGYGSSGRRRTLVEEETITLSFTAQEARIQNLESYYDLGVHEYKENAFYAKKRRNARVREYQALCIGYDGAPQEEIYPYWYYPNVSYEKRGKQQLVDNSTMDFPYELLAKEDPDFGALFGFGIAGPGFTPQLAAEMGIPEAIAVTKTFKFSLQGATGGTFDLRVGTVTVKGQAHNVTHNALQQALRSAGLEAVEVSGSAAAGFVFKKLGSKPVVDASKLTGGDFPKSVDVTEES